MAQSAITAGTIAGGNKVIQMVYNSSATVGSTTTAFPGDDTIPQNTEGAEFITQAITPTSASNNLVIEVFVPVCEINSASYWSGAIFQDSTANALASSTLIPTGSTYVQQFYLMHIMTAGTTSSTTFKFRYGPINTLTAYINQSSAGRLFGGIATTFLKITEIEP
jgi:hypothetical protein